MELTSHPPAACTDAQRVEIANTTSAIFASETAGPARAHQAERRGTYVVRARVRMRRARCCSIVYFDC
jgi:hypothetical protein